jgi:membrane protein required for colicin V production
LGAFLLYALFTGKMAFIELASLISLILGIYIAIKCSYMIRAMLANVSWSKYIEIIAFGLTFIAVVAVHILAKLLTGIMDFAFLEF